ncbi:hypothetical protein BJ508DRAFT_333729 [Ascobolus immersus RN42]|uniref:Uncharacterized protein n=1 Tax=Ascobolus immersus RN42 TaxID=1160509 RepID=A0A3N4HIL1_ASCIM|nr:hypothetical protein BJ508DRAFT_333729 [Ascobolus immersus RN42]
MDSKVNDRIVAPPDRTQVAVNDCGPEKLANRTDSPQSLQPVINQSFPSSKWASKPLPNSTPVDMHSRVSRWIEDQPIPRTPRRIGLNLQFQTTVGRRRQPLQPLPAPRTAGPDPRALVVRQRLNVPAPRFDSYPPSPPIIVSSDPDLTEEEPLRTGMTSNISISDVIVRRTSGVREQMRPDNDTETQSTLSSLPSSLDLSNSPTMLASTLATQKEVLCQRPPSATGQVRDADEDREQEEDDREATAPGEAEMGHPHELPPIRLDQCPFSQPQTVHNLPETSSPESSTPVTKNRLPPTPVIRDAVKIIAAQNLIPALYVLRLEKVREAIGWELWRVYQREHPAAFDEHGWEYNPQDWESLLLRFGANYTEWYKDRAPSVVITDSVVTTDPVVTTGGTLSPVVTWDGVTWDE